MFPVNATGIALLLQSSDTSQKCAPKLRAKKKKTIILGVGEVWRVRDDCVQIQSSPHSQAEPSTQTATAMLPTGDSFFW